MKLSKKLSNFIKGLRNIQNDFEKIKFEIRRQFLEIKILECKEKGTTDEKYCDNEIIVSLTSYGKRINEVPLTIESLMQQTRKANRIILWLSDDVDMRNLPNALKEQEKRGLEIKLCSDLKSYKKLIPTLLTYPDAAIITADDDLLYDFDFLDRLIRSYLKEPQAIHALRTLEIKLDEKGHILPYEEWGGCVSVFKNPKCIFFTTGGGVLFPPHSLPQETLDAERFMSLCPTGDDIWFNAMARVKGTSIVKAPSKNLTGEEFIYIPYHADDGLWTTNLGKKGSNDKQIKDVFSAYSIESLLR